MLAEVGRQLAASGLELCRAQPRGDVLHVEARDTSGQLRRGQWVPDPDQAEAIARETAQVAPGLVTRCGPHLLVQDAGADRRLTRLAPLVAGGATLVAHRPERRAVVHDGEGYLKLVRRRRLPDVVDRTSRVAQVPGLRAPRVTAIDPHQGLLRLATVPGTPVHQLLPDLGEASASAVGATVRTLHEAPRELVTDLPRHDLAAETAATRAVVEQARKHGAITAVLAADLRRRTDRAATAIDAAGPPRLGLVHRDLHDKQLLVDASGEVGVLDADLLARGDPALDLGNLGAHLCLRAAQGSLSADGAARLRSSVMLGYAPERRLREAADGYAALAEVRLRALYAFRPADSPVAWH